MKKEMTIKELEQRINYLKNKKGYVSNDEVREIKTLQAELSLRLFWNFK